MITEAKEVAINVSIIGHPWDLYGLSRLFNGSNAQSIRVSAKRPRGTPNFDVNNREDRLRFEKMGHSQNVGLTAVLNLHIYDGTGPESSITPEVERLISHINGVAKIIDRRFFGIQGLWYSYEYEDLNQFVPLADPTPNRSTTDLSDELSNLACMMLEISQRSASVDYVLSAWSMPTTWTGLYLIYECIGDSVGGVNRLKKRSFVNKKDLSDFTKAANNIKDLKQGARHGSISETIDEPLISLKQAQSIILTLTLSWLHHLISEM